MRRACLGLFLCSSFLWAGSAQKSTELIITNVNVVDTRYGGIQPNVTVIVKDGVIVAVTKVAILNTGLNEILVACSYVSKDADALPIEHPDTLAQAWVTEESDAPYDRKKAWDLFLKMSDHATWMVPSLISLQTVPEVSTSSEVSATARASAPDGPNAHSSEIPASADAMLAFNLVSGMRRAGVQFLAGTNGPGADLMP